MIKYYFDGKEFIEAHDMREEEDWFDDKPAIHFTVKAKYWQPGVAGWDFVLIKERFNDMFKKTKILAYLAWLAEPAEEEKPVWHANDRKYLNTRGEKYVCCKWLSD